MTPMKTLCTMLKRIAKDKDQSKDDDKWVIIRTGRIFKIPCTLQGMKVVQRM